MVKLLLITTSIFLSGCFFTKEVVRVPEIKIETQYVKEYVPIPCPTPPEVVRPELVIFQLTPEDSMNSGKVVQAYKASLLQLQQYSIDLETILNAYRNQKPVITDETK